MLQYIDGFYKYIMDGRIYTWFKNKQKNGIKKVSLIFFLFFQLPEQEHVAQKKTLLSFIKVWSKQTKKNEWNS